MALQHSIFTHAVAEIIVIFYGLVCILNLLKSRFLTSCFYILVNCLLFASSFLFFFKAGYCFLVCNHIGVNILWLIDILFQTRYILSLFRKLVGFQCTCVGPVVFLLFTFLLFFFFLILQMSPAVSKSGDLKCISERDTDRDSPATQ